MLMSIQPPGYVSSILRWKLTAVLIFLISLHVYILILCFRIFLFLNLIAMTFFL